MTFSRGPLLNIFAFALPPLNNFRLNLTSQKMRKPARINLLKDAIPTFFTSRMMIFGL